MQILGISGSLRRGSFNTALLRTAEGLAPDGVELVLFDRLGAIPPFDEDMETEPACEAVWELREAIRAADAVLVATPEYNHSLPGQLKNALDWASRPAGQSALKGKPAAAIGASKSMFGGVWSQAELRKVLAAMGGRVLDAELPVAQAQELAVDGRLELPPQQTQRLREILADLVAMAAELEAERQAVAA